MRRSADHLHRNVLRAGSESPAKALRERRGSHESDRTATPMACGHRVAALPLHAACPVDMGERPAGRSALPPELGKLASGRKMSPRKLLVALLAAAFPLSAGASQWSVTFGEVGPLRLGMSMATMNRVLGEDLAAPKVPGADPVGRCFYVDPPREPALQLMIIEGRLARIDVVKSGIKTTKGVAVGDTEASVLAAYGTRIAVEPASGDPHSGRFLTVLSPDKAYGMRFVTLHGKVQQYYSGTAQAIRYVEGCA